MVYWIRHNNNRRNAKDKAISDRQEISDIINDENAKVESIRVRYDYEEAAELAPAIKPILRSHTTENILEKAIADTFVIGTVAGILGTVVMHIISMLWEYLGLITITTLEVSGEIFLSPDQINTFAGYVVSMTAHFIIGAAGGVLLAYFMKFSGCAFYWLKGLGLAGFMLLAGMGLVVNVMGIAPQMKNDAIGVMLHIITYQVYGLTVAYIIYKLNKTREIQH